MTKTTGHTFDRRDTKCKLCGKLFRREDVNKEDICAWCAWERLAWWKKHSRFVARLWES